MSVLSFYFSGNSVLLSFPGTSQVKTFEEAIGCTVQCQNLDGILSPPHGAKSF